MMGIEIGYVRSGVEGKRREDVISLREASSVELMYSCFVGNVKFRVGDQDLSTNFNWVPLLHFANNLDLIWAGIDSGEVKYYYFTESEDFIRFSERGGDVLIECSYVSSGRATVNRIDGMFALRKAASDLMSSLEESYYELRYNPIFAEIAERMRNKP
jgi:hypothetical protein